MPANAILFVLMGLAVAILCLLVLIWRRMSVPSDWSPQSAQVSHRLETLDQGLSKKFTELAIQLEKTRGELNLEIIKQFSVGLSSVRSAVDAQLVQGREEQAASTNRSSTALERKLEQLSQRQSASAQEARGELTRSLEAIRNEVDRKLNDITGQVQQKLDQNIKEGFAHFAKVQEHLKAAEEQLRNVGTLGNSIHDLNNLLKLPHLRGKFGEASLERLLADFLPAHMFELQAGPEGSAGRADAMINFPERRMPIDAKFPREQVLALFQQESASDAELAEARKNFERVMKDQAKRIRGYIQPENGTTDFALMYLPSETLYMEAVRNHDLSDELNRMKVFPVSPNTLMVTLNAVAMVHKWYKLREGLAESVKQFEKAKKSFTSFESKFEVIGKSLERAQEAYSSAGKHLTQYKTRVLQVDEIPELPFENGSEALAEAMEKKALAEKAEAAGRS